MNGTNRKIFGKSGRSGAVLAFACLFIMAMALAFTACEEAEEADPIASEFQGAYSGFTAIGYNSVTVTVGADSITVGSNTLTGVSTNGGASDSGTGYSRSWAYVWHDGDKVGIVSASTISNSAGSLTGGGLGLGPDAAEEVAEDLSDYEVDADVSDVVSAGSNFDGYFYRLE